jgi:hypothetical protein
LSKTGEKTLRARERRAPTMVCSRILIKIAGARMQLALVARVHAAPSSGVSEHRHHEGI